LPSKWFVTDLSNKIIAKRFFLATIPKRFAKPK